MREYFIVDKSTDNIVNCVTTARKPDDTVFGFGSEYYATTNPTQQQLNGYRYYWERP